MTDLEYWRGFLTWADAYYEMYPNDPGGPCGFATLFARRRDAAALRDPGLTKEKLEKMMRET